MVVNSERYMNSYRTRITVSKPEFSFWRLTETSNIGTSSGRG
ncbi:hypothetical protein [Nostoc sp. 'Peltigera membranacea cyanobiont' 210A]|nr:hypothetical protein [Nostoc sp. 'Peltigera membranacea cyanobiont' 210A]